MSSIGGGALSPSKSQQLLPSRPALSQPGLCLDVGGRRKGPLERLATLGTSFWSGRVLRLRLPPVEVSRAWGLRWGGGCLTLEVLSCWKHPGPFPGAGKTEEALRVPIAVTTSPQEVSPALSLLSCTRGSCLSDGHLKPLRALGAGAQDLLVPFVPWPHRPRHAGPSAQER